MKSSPLLIELSALFHDVPPSPETWLASLDKILLIMDCVTGTIHGFDPETQRLKLLAHRGIPDELLSKVDSIPLGKGIAGAAAERREAVEMCNLQTDESGTARPGAKKTQVAGSLAVPILSGETLLGTVGVGKYVPHDFTGDEKSALWEISRILAGPLQDAC